MIKFSVIYLVQGRASLVASFLKQLPLESNIIALTWDEPLIGVANNWANEPVFYPNSTWAEGRNFLLQTALEKYKEFDYLVFCDDDAEFSKNALNEFEKFLHHFKPAIGLPLSDSIKKQLINSDQEYDISIRHDQIVQAFSFKVVNEKKVLPYDLSFDKVSWYLTCELNQYLIQKFYFKDTLTFNNVLVSNTHHEMLVESSGTSAISSRYLGGVSKEQIRELRKYIEMKYGRQKKCLDTIFQPSIFSKFRLVNLNKNHLSHWSAMLQKNRTSFLKFGFKIAFTLITNWWYRMFRRDSVLGY